MEPISPCVCRNASRYVVRSVRQVSIAQIRVISLATRDVRRGALHTPLRLLTEPDRQITPLARLSLYSVQLITRYCALSTCAVGGLR